VAIFVFAPNSQITDGFMFAGMFGTTHLVTKTVALIRTDPVKYVALFKANPKAFLLESSRYFLDEVRRIEEVKFVILFLYKFKSYCISFLPLTSRIDPPVTSVTSLYSSEERVEFGRSYESTVTTSIGMTKQLLIVNANAGTVHFLCCLF
jgi:hypothetical protein